MPLRIAIAEPDADVSALYRTWLTDLGHTVAEDGGRIDALIFEPASPSAVETAHRLRDGNPELLIICASIHPRGRDLTIDPDVYLEEPFSRSTLEAALRSVITRRRPLA